MATGTSVTTRRVVRMRHPEVENPRPVAGRVVPECAEPAAVHPPHLDSPGQLPAGHRQGHAVDQVDVVPDRAVAADRAAAAGRVPAAPRTRHAAGRQARRGRGVQSTPVAVGASGGGSVAGRPPAAGGGVGNVWATAGAATAPQSATARRIRFAVMRPSPRRRVCPPAQQLPLARIAGSWVTSAGRWAGLEGSRGPTG